MKTSNAKKRNSRSLPSGTACRVLIEALQDRRLLSASTITVQPSLLVSPAVTNTVLSGYTPAQIKAAYGFGSSATAGAGETIAIIDAYNDPNIAADLTTFDKQFSLAAPPSLKVASETGSTTQLPATNASWDMEISLDVEWAHAIAPDANILLVEANSSSLGDLLNAVSYAKTVSSVATISMSWGGSEFRGETSYDSIFTTPAGHQGITFVAASGDEGSRYGVEWPATSSNVLAVGGTTLTLNSSGAYSSETTWSGSTGGVSAYESESASQKSAQSTGRRTDPDVAFDANPSTGFAVYDSVPYSGTSGWYEVGGTSAGAPQWAALIAAADATRGSSLDGATQTIPALYSIFSNSTTYAQDFNDIVSGSSNGLYSAAKGYDLVTGLGSPKASSIIAALAHVSGTSSAAAATNSASASHLTVASYAWAGESSRFAGATYQQFDPAVDGIHWASQAPVVQAPLPTQALNNEDVASSGTYGKTALFVEKALNDNHSEETGLSSFGSIDALSPITHSFDSAQTDDVYPMQMTPAEDSTEIAVDTAGSKSSSQSQRTTRSAAVVSRTKLSAGSAQVLPTATLQAATGGMSLGRSLLAIAGGVATAALIVSKHRPRRNDEVVAGFIYNLGE